MKKTVANDENFIVEIVHTVNEQDLIKAKILIRETTGVSPETAKKLLLEIINSEDSFTVPLLVHIMTYHLDLLALNSSIKKALDEKLSSYQCLYDIYKILDDRNEKCFFIENLSDKETENVERFLIEIISKETDTHILSSTLKAMSELQNIKFASYVADFLYSDESALVKLAVSALGSCGTDFSVDQLVNRSGADAAVDRLIVQTIAKIKSVTAIKCLVTFLSSDNASLRNASRSALALIGAEAIPYLVECLNSPNKNRVIIALNILGESGIIEAVKPVRNFIESLPKDANTRFAAFEALGFLPGKTGAYTLTQGILDEDEGVRVAAARAINQQFDPLFERGISNLFKTESNQVFITDAVLTSESNKIVSSMVHIADFNQCAVKILKKSNDKELIDFYTGLAKNINLTCNIGEFKKKQVKVSKQGIIVVDDSRLLLRIYKKILTELEADFHLFEFANEALDYISDEKPALILTDLNMPVMDGIQFTKSVRDKYSKDQVPVIMVTTQDEEADRSAAFKAGVQDYLQKPFDKKAIQEIIKMYM